MSGRPSSIYSCELGNGIRERNGRQGFFRATFEIAEVPTTLSLTAAASAPHLRPWRDGWRHLRFMLLRSPQWLFLYPGLAFTLFGLAGGAVLAARPVSFFGLLTLDINALLYCAIAAIVGLEISFFGLFAIALARRLHLTRRGVRGAPS